MSKHEQALYMILIQQLNILRRYKKPKPYWRWEKNDFTC